MTTWSPHQIVLTTLPYGDFYFLDNEGKRMEEHLDKAFDDLDVPRERREAVRAMLAPLKLKSRFHWEHSIRVGILAKQIGEFMHVDAKALFYAGILHDVGKALVPPATLHKTDAWTEHDSAVMKPHVLDGFRLLQGAFDFSAQILAWHHKFQRDCYPSNMPTDLHEYSPGTVATLQMYGRLLAIADTFDALHRINSKTPHPNHWTIRKQIVEFNKDQAVLVNKLIEADVLPVPRCYDLKRLKTRELVRYRDRALRTTSCVAQYENPDVKPGLYVGGYDPTENHGPQIPYEDIIAELNTREHVPNKQEAKALRRAKQKSGKKDRPRRSTGVRR